MVRKQSPIDITEAKEKGQGSITWDRKNYKESALRLINNGHTVQANIDSGSVLDLGAAGIYDLLQFHFHTLSEHTVKEKSLPMEAHLVHRSKDEGLAVLDVLFVEGAANSFLQTLWPHLPDHVGHEYTVKDASIRADGLLPKDLKYYQYAGSLTTPPCSEGVRWHALKTPVEASKAQIEKLTEMIGPNARPVQPLNDRVVS